VKKIRRTYYVSPYVWVSFPL